VTNGLTDFLRIEKKVVTKQKDVFIGAVSHRIDQGISHLHLKYQHAIIIHFCFFKVLNFGAG